jgi:hypothetical protein
MIHLPPEINGWVCTDTDCFQYQKDLSETIFNMVQAFNISDTGFIIAKGIIDLDDYTEKEIECFVTAYYDSVGHLKNEYGAKSNGIIAECIFESLQPIDYAYQFPAINEAKAKEIVFALITRA